MINQVTLVGRLTKDPELRLTPEGNAVTNVTLAVNRPFRNGHGDVDADFVQCTLWRRTAENTVKYCRKGSLIGITGRIQTRNYSNQEGQKVYVTEVIADNVNFLGTKKVETQGGDFKREAQTQNNLSMMVQEAESTLPNPI